MNLYPTIFFVVIGVLSTIYTFYDLFIGNVAFLGEVTLK